MAEIKVLSSIAPKRLISSWCRSFRRLRPPSLDHLGQASRFMQRMADRRALRPHRHLQQRAHDPDQAGQDRCRQRVDLAKSGIASRCGRRAAAGRPPPASAEAALLAADGGYTSGPSGVYMAGLIEKMGIAPRLGQAPGVLRAEPSAPSWRAAARDRLPAGGASSVPFPASTTSNRCRRTSVGHGVLCGLQRGQRAEAASAGGVSHHAPQTCDKHGWRRSELRPSAE